MARIEGFRVKKLQGTQEYNIGPPVGPTQKTTTHPYDSGYW